VRPVDQENVFAILLLHCFRYLEASGSIWKLTDFAVLHCFDTGELPNSSTFFRNSENSFLVSIILSY